jgi:hypothetical protein
MTMTTWRGGSYTLLTAGILSAAVVAAPAPVATAQPDCGQPPLVNQLDLISSMRRLIWRPRTWTNIPTSNKLCCRMSSRP